MASCIDASAGNIDFLELISQAETQYSIPQGLLSAIARIESKMNPHALNIGGKSILVSSKEEANYIVNTHLKNSVTNIDIGIMQLNYRWHSKHFSSVEEMLDPILNIKYAAQLMSDLYKQHGSWQAAVRHYHSANPKYHKKYSRQIILAWLS
ncbi:MAG: lytic transglycosylase domain-containing protein [Sphingobacteriaceae bacterium]|nr:MAG: lytic transglycosylase domain-containing protein [Sphingobacteriaceae bacterium]